RRWVWSFGRALQRRRGSRGILDRTRDGVRSAACPSLAWGLGDKTATTLPPPACRQTRRAERLSSSKRYFSITPGEGPALRLSSKLRVRRRGDEAARLESNGVWQPLRHGLSAAPPPPAPRGEETERRPVSSPCNGEGDRAQ